ncbi:HAMP domain-containing sensor histidine kinase [Oscillibacter sp.]|uniref:sensor histidine kinase n=1 Tax=Oscillibacter sp. TaxID=1945593 RepID=UPI002636B0FC|nr:HAMP domain-containing sensor histidine kinase [Oscillibacter sp.]MDD3346091.1 HAMP domain-containing sensor histidine kinase [Oscillibacter sp.]
MIRKLRLKFVAICMALVTAILAVVFLLVFFSVERNVETLSRQVLHRVAQESAYMDGSGIVRPDIGITVGGDRVLLPYFTVEVWGNRAYITGGTYANLEDTEELQAILTECLGQQETEGTVKTYRLRYLRQDNGLYQKIAFVDMSMELSMLHKLIGSYLGIVCAALLLLLGVSILLSRWATAPVEKAWSQQRQFLSDASHELKTPLTVILSNAELLETATLEERPARWADNINSEARQMKSLVEEMLTLARADNMARAAVSEPFSLSDLAADCALAFEPVAFEAGKPLEYEIAEAVTVSGDRDKLRQVLSILLDNAIKYGADGGVIRLTLEKTDRQAKVTVSNTGTPIPSDQLPHLFERFYRADASRGEQSGFGLGLSIAAAIAKEHKTALRVESDLESTRFFFTLPLKRSAEY